MRLAFYTLSSMIALASARPLRTVSSVHARQQTQVDTGLEFLDIVQQGVDTYFGQMQETFTSADYAQAGFKDGEAISDVISTIAGNEHQHHVLLRTLANEIGETLPKCNFDFTSALVNVPTALKVARDILYIAIGGYAGTISSEPNSSFIEQFAENMGSIARGAELMNVMNQGVTLAQSFDISMTAQEVLTVFQPFQPTCNPQFSLQPFPQFNVTGIENGILSLDISNTPCANQAGLFCQLLDGSGTSFIPLAIDQCDISGFSGEILIYITTDDVSLPSTSPDRNTAAPDICAGPVMLFNDHATLFDKLLLSS